MFSTLRELFEKEVLPTSESDPDHAERLSTAALLVEMTRADFAVSDQERSRVAGLVRTRFDLGRDEADELLSLAEREADAATSLFQFTSLLNGHLSAQQKAHVVELLWEVAFSDGDLDRYEEHLVRRVADLLHVPHADFMQAKHRVAGMLDRS